MADAVSEPTPSAAATKREEQALVIARRRAEEKVPRHKFGLAYLLLAALLGAAVGLAVVFTTDDSGKGKASWSTWRPQDTGVKRLAEIADHVSNQYATSSGRKLVVAYSTPPVAQGADGSAAPVRAIAVTPGLAGQSAADANIEDASGAWAYVLCGLGKNCSIAGPPAQATEARFALIQREALELALYTFKYEDRINSVLAYIPPAPNAPNGAQVNTMIMLRRDDVKGALSSPLSATLSPITSTLRPGKMSARDRTNVLALTNSRVFGYRGDTLQDGSPILVLDQKH